MSTPVTVAPLPRQTTPRTSAAEVTCTHEGCETTTVTSESLARVLRGGWLCETHNVRPVPPSPRRVAQE